MRRVVVLALVLVFGLTGSVYAANSALLFDGQDDYVRVLDSNSLDLTTGMTIEAWIKSDTTSGSRVIASKWSDLSGDQSYIFKDHNDSDKLRIELSREGHNDLADLEGKISITTGNWVHVAATYDPSSVKLFYNGVLDNSGDPKVINSQIDVGLTDLLIGSAPGEYFDGLIDEVRIWNYARTQQELQSNMFYSLTGQEAGLMAYWNFDEESGQMVNDLTGNANNGQLGSAIGVDESDPQRVLSDGLYGQARGNVQASPVRFADNGHYYKLVSFDAATPLTWPQAVSSAASMSYLGASGYLATITSAQENAFLVSNFPEISQDTYRFAWVAGYEPCDDGVWRWAAGAEYGAQFSFWANPTAPYSYANWGGIEPNDHKMGEDYLMFNTSNGYWADAIDTANWLDPVGGYFVEFEPVDGEGVIPEPSSLLLLGLGGLLLGRRRR